MKKMIKKKPISCLFLFRIKRAVTTCALPVDPSDIVVSTSSGNHKSLRLSLVEELIQRGLLSPAQQVFQQMIRDSVSVSDICSVADSVVGYGLSLDLGSYGALIKKLVMLGQPQLAESLYLIEIESRGINPDPSILNSMVICLCKLGKLEEAVNLFDRLLSFNSPPYKEACDSILKQCCAQKRYLDAYAFFLRAQDAGSQFSFRCCSLLVDELCHRGHMEEALQVFDILRKCVPSLPTVHMYKSIFYGLCKRGNVVEAELIFGDMESQGMYIDKTMYTSVVHEYCKKREMNMAMRVFFRMLKTSCEPDVRICSTLIYGFTRLGRYDKGWIIYNKMKEWGIKPDAVTHQIMISQFCKKGETDRALKLLKNMINSNLVLNVHCYTVLIRALCKQNKIEEVSELLEKMMERGVVPDHVLFLNLVKTFPHSELQLAFTILLALANNGCGFDSSTIPASTSHNPIPDLEQESELLVEKIARKNINLASAAYGILISALCEKGKIDKAFLCLNKMDAAGCRPLRFCYNSLIKCLSRLELFDDANFVIDLMEAHGFVPDQTTYFIIVKEMCEQGNLVSVYDLLDQMAESGITPGVAIYNSIIGCLCKKRRIFEAENMFMRMFQSGVEPDGIVYTTMINGYSLNGRTLEACQLFHKMIENSMKPDSHSYTSLISGLVKRNMIDAGCVYLRRMLEDGIEPNAVFYTCLIKHFLKSGEFAFAFKLFNLAGKNEIKWDHIMCVALINGVCRYIYGTKNKKCIMPRQSDRDKEMLLQLLHRSPFPLIEDSIRVSTNCFEEVKCLARKLLENIRGVPIIPDLYVNNCIISWFCKEGMIHDAWNQFQLMQNEGVSPNHVTYTILLDGFIRLDDIDNAVRMFNKMNLDDCAPDFIAYNTLLEGFIRGGRLLDAMSLMYAMRKRGLYPKWSSYEKLLYCFFRSGLSVHAFRIFQEMVAQNYENVLYDRYNLSECNRLHEDDKVLDLILQVALENGEKKLLMNLKSNFS